MAYKCNKDDDRAAFLRVREHLMTITKSKDNIIEEDNVKIRDVYDRLPDVYKPKDANLS